MEDVVFSQIDFGLLIPLLENEDVTDISYSNGGQLWVKTLSRGVYAEHVEGLNNEVIEKLAFQCSNVMGKSFNMAHPFLDAESAELRMNFVHDSIASNGRKNIYVSSYDPLSPTMQLEDITDQAELDMINEVLTQIDNND